MKMYSLKIHMHALCFSRLYQHFIKWWTYIFKWKAFLWLQIYKNSIVHNFLCKKKCIYSQYFKTASKNFSIALKTMYILHFNSKDLHALSVYWPYCGYTYFVSNVNRLSEIYLQLSGLAVYCLRTYETSEQLSLSSVNRILFTSHGWRDVKYFLVGLRYLNPFNKLLTKWKNTEVILHRHYVNISTFKIHIWALQFLF